MLPGALARAAHHQQVAVAEIVPDRASATAARSEQQSARRAEDDQRDHRVVRAAPPDAVAVPGHRVPAVAVEAEPGGGEPLAQLGLVVLVQHLLGLDERGVGGGPLPAEKAKQPGNAADLW